MKGLEGTNDEIKSLIVDEDKFHQILEQRDKLKALSNLQNKSLKWEGFYESAAILKAEHEVVPFQGREAELATLAAWYEDASATRLSIRTYIAAGDAGKTRMMIEAVQRQACQEGWVCGFLDSKRGIGQ